MIFLISIICTLFSPERTRALLGGKREGIGNILAATLGIITPFCSCSVLAFMMSAVGLGLPEVIILRWMLKPKLLIIFFGAVAIAIILTGYLFNWIL